MAENLHTSEVMETKVCAACLTEKPLSEYYIKKETGNPHNRCKQCCIHNVKTIKVEKTTKTCKHCGEDKPFSEYQKAGGGKWLQPYCKPCDAERKRKHAKANQERYQERSRKYQAENKEQITEKRKEYYEKKKDEIIQYQKQYREQNADKCKARQEKYRAEKKEWLYAKSKQARKDNPELYRAKDKLARESRTPEQKARDAQKRKEWEQKNKHILYEKYRERKRKNRREFGARKMATDPAFRILKNLRSRIRVAIKGVKSDTTENLLGCTIPEFKAYLESKFLPGMSWENYGKFGWHIDHIIPCAKFDLTTEEGQRACFIYTNQQPLFWQDNLKKGAS
jgi:hypothetical protein